MTVLVVLLILVVACVALWLWAIAPQLPRADFSAFAKYDYAHRGLHDKDNGVPENSLKAFALAAQCGFGMELDLQLTKDNRVVVHHDHSIQRTCGVDKLISDMTLEELWGYRLLGTEEKVPLFSQVLETVGGRTPLIIELKDYNDNDTLCRLAMEELAGYQGLYCVESFDPRIVWWFRQNRPEIVRGQLMERLEKGQNGLTASQAFFGRNMMTNFHTRPQFEAYDFHARNVPSLKGGPAGVRHAGGELDPAHPGGVPAGQGPGQPVHLRALSAPGERLPGEEGLWGHPRRGGAGEGRCVQQRGGEEITGKREAPRPLPSPVAKPAPPVYGGAGAALPRRRGRGKGRE